MSAPNVTRDGSSNTNSLVSNHYQMRTLTGTIENPSKPSSNHNRIPSSSSSCRCTEPTPVVKHSNVNRKPNPMLHNNKKNNTMLHNKLLGG
mmetsp:Transcript_19853/g.37341  ORF Transcript_19853/g.37341 Transcript_19853/m.37341 type:complete len:91 (-) Transcript_19853:2819-3091(-)